MAKKKPINKLEIEKGFEGLFQHIQDQDFQTMEELQNFLDQLEGKSFDEVIPKKERGNSKKERAEEFVLMAYDSSEYVGRKLAKKAIKLDAYNADAYIYLAETADSLQSAFEYYLKGMEVAEQSIGEIEFEELKGHFWLAFETRPYMKAKRGLAACLDLLGNYDEAINQYKEMLDLNPSDNQGIRFDLADVLVEQNRKEDYLQLYSKYKDDGSAAWLYMYALFLFKQKGNSNKAKGALKKAYKANAFVIEFMVGDLEMPSELPENYMSFGDESEAVLYLEDYGEAWLGTEGALSWAFEFYTKL